MCASTLISLHQLGSTVAHDQGCAECAQHVECHSLIFRHTFSTLASAAIWSDERHTKYHLEFEAALAESKPNWHDTTQSCGVHQVEM